MPTCVGCSQEVELSAAFCPRCGTPNPDALPTPHSGETTEQLPVDELRMKLQAALGADFHVERLLGEGGFALVFQVQDRKLSRKIAVKILRPELTASRSSMRRFVREAESAAGLNQPNSLPISFVGEGRGLVYFGMPLVEGETLDALMKREGQLPEAEVVRIGSAVAEALSEAHARSLIHRDVKPANILLQGEHRRPLVADFGIAKAAGGGDHLTGTGTVIGSPHYMSPEQASGESSIDFRSDIYSLGVVLWQMLAGALPFDGPDSHAILVQHITKALPSLKAKRPGVSAGLAKVVARCTAKRPEERYQTAAEVALALRECVLGAGVLRRRWPVVVGVAAGVVLAAAAIVGTLVLRDRESRSAAGQAEPVQAAPRSEAPMVAVLPFDVNVTGDSAQLARQFARIVANRMESRFGLGTVDPNVLLGRWNSERRRVSAPLDSNAAFAYSLSANQLVVGNAFEDGRRVRYGVDVYDTRTYHRIGRHYESNGSPGDYTPVLEQLAESLAVAFCQQPEFNPRNLCFDVAAQPVAPLEVLYNAAGGQVPPSPSYYVRVTTGGGQADVRIKGVAARAVGARALAAVTAAVYRPARKAGRLVEAWTTVVVAVRAGTVAPAAVPVSCARPDTGLLNANNSCYDTRPNPRTPPIIAAPPSCTREVTPATVLMRVNASGDVEMASVNARSNCGAFTEVALAFARELVFAPGRKGGAPVSAWIKILIRPMPSGSGQGGVR